MPISEPLDVLSANARCELAAPEPAPADVGAGVADERADEDLDDGPVAMQRLAGSTPWASATPIQATPKP